VTSKIDKYCYTGIPIRDAPDTVFAGYPANPKAGYQISARAGYRISGRILGLATIFLVKYQINL
jgi:hypothetical protein